MAAGVLTSISVFSSTAVGSVLMSRSTVIVAANVRRLRWIDASVEGVTLLGRLRRLSHGPSGVNRQISCFRLLGTSFVGFRFTSDAQRKPPWGPHGLSRSHKSCEATCSSPEPDSPRESPERDLAGRWWWLRRFNEFGTGTHHDLHGLRGGIHRLNGGWRRATHRALGFDHRDRTAGIRLSAHGRAPRYTSR